MSSAPTPNEGRSAELERIAALPLAERARAYAGLADEVAAALDDRAAALDERPAALHDRPPARS